MKRFLKWLDNYWYHYKWHTIIVASILLVIALIIPQMLSQKDGEADILYCGPITLNGEQADAIQKEFAKYLPKDDPSDDSKHVDITTVFLLNEAQIAERVEQGSSVSPELIRSNREALRAELVSGDTLICLMDPAFYEEYRKQGAFAKWEDTLGVRPANAMDDYAVRLKDTDFARYAGDAFASLPDDTVLCMRTPPVMNVLHDKEEASERYALHLALFQRILQFTVS